MAKRDYYEVLGLGREASESELKSAFRKQAMQWHPDRNPGDAQAEARFRELSEAYEVLKDPQKRAAYDRYGHAAFEQGGGGGGPGFGSDFAFSMADIFENIFNDSFTRGRTRGGRERGADLRYNLDITLEDAFHGKTADLRLPTALVCETCSGSGAKAGSQAKTCRTCQGLGRVRATQGFFSIERTCPTCQGQGETIEDPCPACQGAGRVVRERQMSVNVPAGVEEGTRIRLSGEGEAGLRGGPAGDLYIFLSIAPHAFFQREGADLFCRSPISMTLAALGGTFEAPTIEGGRTRVKASEGTQNGRRFTLKNKGMPVLRSQRRGDLHIDVVVETPRNLTKRQRELLEEFDKASSEETHPESAGWFARVKEIFEGGGRRS